MKNLLGLDMSFTYLVNDKLTVPLWKF